jgi:hypothetical protein
MASHFVALCFDANDPLRLARFWAGVLCWELIHLECPLRSSSRDIVRVRLGKTSRILAAGLQPLLIF